MPEVGTKHNGSPKYAVMEELSKILTKLNTKITIFSRRDPTIALELFAYHIYLLTEECNEKS